MNPQTVDTSHEDITIMVDPPNHVSFKSQNERGIYENYTRHHYYQKLIEQESNVLTADFIKFQKKLIEFEENFSGEISISKLKKDLKKYFVMLNRYEQRLRGIFEKKTLPDHENHRLIAGDKLLIDKAIRDVKKKFREKTKNNRESIAKLGQEISLNDFYLEVKRLSGENEKIKVKISPNIADEEGNTLLHLSVIRQNEIIVQLLLNRGARKNMFNKRGKTPLDLAHQQQNSKSTELLEQRTEVPEQERTLQSRNTIISYNDGYIHSLLQNLTGTCAEEMRLESEQNYQVAIIQEAASADLVISRLLIDDTLILRRKNERIVRNINENIDQQMQLRLCQETDNVISESLSTSHLTWSSNVRLMRQRFEKLKNKLWQEFNQNLDLSEEKNKRTAIVDEYLDQLNPVDNEEDIHCYTDDEMNAMLQFYLKNSEDTELLTAMLGTNLERGNDLEANLIQFQQQRVEAIARGETVRKKVVIPVNLNQNHWALLYFIYQEGTALPAIYYFDPLGALPPQDILNSLSKLFCGVEITNISARVQEDNYNCGPWVIEAAKAIIQNGAIPGAEFDIKKARKEHSEVSRAKYRETAKKSLKEKLSEICLNEYRAITNQFKKLVAQSLEEEQIFEVRGTTNKGNFLVGVRTAARFFSEEDVIPSFEEIVNKSAIKYESDQKILDEKLKKAEDELIQINEQLKTKRIERENKVEEISTGEAYPSFVKRWKLDDPTCKKFFIENGISSPDAVVLVGDHQELQLYVATNKDDVGKIELLLEAGADPFAYSKMEDITFFYFCATRKPYLLKYVAKILFQPELTNPESSFLCQSLAKQEIALGTYVNELVSFIDLNIRKKNKNKRLTLSEHLQLLLKRSLINGSYEIRMKILETLYRSLFNAKENGEIWKYDDAVVDAIKTTWRKGAFNISEIRLGCSFVKFHHETKTRIDIEKLGQEIKNRTERLEAAKKCYQQPSSETTSQAIKVERIIREKENQELRDQLNDQKKDAEKKVKDAKQEATDAKQEATEAKQEATDAKQEATEAKQEATDAEKKATDAKQEAMEAKEQIKELNLRLKKVVHEQMIEAGFFPRKFQSDNRPYTEIEMRNLLQHYLANNTEIAFLTEMLSVRDERENALRDSLIEFQNQRISLTKQNKIPTINRVIIPIHLDENHWSMLYLIYPESILNTPPHIYYFNPAGKVIPQQISEVLEGLFPGAPVAYRGERKGHRYNRGTWVIEAAKMVAEGGSIPGDDYYINGARLEHLEVLESLNQQDDSESSLTQTDEEEDPVSYGPKQ